MSKFITAAVVGFIVAAVLGFGMNALNHATGAKADFTTFFVPVFFGAITAYLMANLAGNRKVANASEAEKAQALTFQPPEGQGLLIVYREGFVGKAVGLNLALDDRPFAQIKAPRFTAIAVTPGEHVLTAGFGGLAGPQNKTNFSKVTFQPGQVLAVKAGVAMGVLTNTIKLEPTAADETLRGKLRRMPMVKPE